MSPAAASVLRGTVGFTAVSLAAYALWAFAGTPLTRHLKEGGFYAVMTLVFLVLSGLALHPLVRGPNSLRRFMKAFVPAFLAYAAVWCAAWFALKFGLGEWLGSAGGALAFALVVGAVLGNLKAVPVAALVLFVTHSAGYFLGGQVCYSLLKEHRVAAMLLWGLFYGLGFGAGIGYAFHALQKADPTPTAA